MNSEATISMQAYDQTELEMIKPNKNVSSLKDPKPRHTDSNKTVSNDSYFSSFNEKEGTQLYNEEVVFSMEDELLTYDLTTVMMSCPALSRYIMQIKGPKPKITINLPRWITKKALLEYFFYYKNKITTESTTLNYHSLLRLADCFENDTLLDNIIKTKIIPTLSYDSAMCFIQESYQKNDKRHFNFIWYELFKATKEFIGENIIEFIHKDGSKIKQFDRHLLEEIIEHYLLLTHELETVLFDFLMTIRSCNNIYDLIVSEYLISSSEENITHLLNSTEPFLQYYIRDSNSFYKEIQKKYTDSLTLIFLISYKETDDIFNINFKIKTEDRSKIYSFTFISYFNDGEGKKHHSSVKVISNTKGSINLLQLYQFKQRKNKQLTLLVKMNPIHSFTLQYLTINFRIYSNDHKIVKLSHTLLKQIILILKSQKFSDEAILNSVNLWLNDEINLNDEKISEFLDLINWKNISVRKVFSFVIKYVSLIEKAGMEQFFINECNIPFEIFNGIKEANCTNLINENFQLKKAIMIIQSKPHNFEMNKEVSEISKINHINSLFEESEEEEKKKYIPSSSEKKSIMNQRLINNLQNTKRTSVSVVKKFSSEIHLDNKTVFDFYEPIRTIEYEINSRLKNEIEPYTSLSAEVLPKALEKNKQKRQSTKKQVNLSTKNITDVPSSSLPNNKTKTSSTITHKSNHSIKTDRTLSSSGQVNKKKPIIKNTTNMSRNIISSPIANHKSTRQLILTKK